MPESFSDRWNFEVGAVPAQGAPPAPSERILIVIRICAVKSIFIRRLKFFVFWLPYCALPFHCTQSMVMSSDCSASCTKASMSSATLEHSS